MEPEKRVRLFELAKELRVNLRAIVEVCHQLGIGPQSQLSGLNPSEVARIRDSIRNTATPPATEPQEATPMQPPPAPQPAAPARPAALRPPVPPPKLATAPVRQLSAVPVLPKMPVLRPVLPQLKPQAVAPIPPAPVSSPVPVAAVVASVSQSGIDELLAVGAKAGLRKLDVIPRVAAIDAECAVFKIRQITERMCAKMLAVKGARKLDAMITEIEQRNLLGEKAVRNLRYIKETANHAVHNTDATVEEEFTVLDVQIAAAALASVIDTALKAKRLKS